MDVIRMEVDRQNLDLPEKLSRQSEWRYCIRCGKAYYKAHEETPYCLIHYSHARSSYAPIYARWCVWYFLSGISYVFLLYLYTILVEYGTTDYPEYALGILVLWPVAWVLSFPLSIIGMALNPSEIVTYHFLVFSPLVPLIALFYGLKLKGTVSLLYKGRIEDI